MMICHIEMGKVFSPSASQRVFRRLTAQAGWRAARASAICHFLMNRCLRIFLSKDSTPHQMGLQQYEASLRRTNRIRRSVKTWPTPLSKARPWVQPQAQSAAADGDPDHVAGLHRFDALTRSRLQDELLTIWRRIGMASAYSQRPAWQPAFIGTSLRISARLSTRA